jgi:multiple sugar transport system substrate-binding protein
MRSSERLRRAGAAVAALATTAVLIGACGDDGEGDQAGTPARKAGEKVTLRFWSWVPGVDKAVDLWNQENPDVQVKLENVPADGAYQKMFSAVKAGNAPDLAQVEYEQIPGFLLEGALEDLSQYDVAQYQDKFAEWQWAQTVFADKVYAIPQASGPMAMYYRADLFDRWGIAPPETWEEYEQAAREVRDHGAYIATFSPDSPGWFTGLAWQAGARWYGYEGDKWVVDVDSPETRRVAQYWERLADQKLVKTEPDFANAWYKDLQDGEIVSWVSAHWGDAILRGNAPDTAGKWRVAPMPQWDDASGPVSGNFGGSSTALLKGAKYPEAAIRFAVWLNTDPESVDLLLKGGYGWPALEDPVGEVPALAEADKFFGGQRYNEVFAEADASVDKDWQWSPTVSATNEYLTDGFKAAINGKGSFVDAIVDADKQTVEDLREKGLEASTR